MKLSSSLDRTMEESMPLSDHLRILLEEDPALSPEVVTEILDELALQKAATDVSIRFLYRALDHFVERFAQEPELRRRTEPLIARLEALEKREADELEEELNARFRVKPGEISALYEWGRRLLEK